MIIRLRLGSNPNVADRQEVRLLVIACVMMLMQIFNGSYHFASYYIVTNKLFEYLPTLIWHFPWINDINNLNAPWVSLIVSKSLKEAMFSRKMKV
ncbi:hypothetical protein AAVH_21750 [Aphelenchoides avenae]|nr:hypothetical protein AAVH_21750 [Aphelenchus avenae]